MHDFDSTQSPVQFHALRGNLWTWTAHTSKSMTLSTFFAYLIYIILLGVAILCDIAQSMASSWPSARLLAAILKAYSGLFRPNFQACWRQPVMTIWGRV